MHPNSSLRILRYTATNVDISLSSWCLQCENFQNQDCLAVLSSLVIRFKMEPCALISV